MRTTLMAFTALGALAAASLAHADDGALSQPGQPGISPPGQQPAVGAGASRNQSAAQVQGDFQGRRPADAPDSLIQEVVVTAEKREQSLQQVPVAVSAFTTEKRDLIGIESVVDQTNYTPGLTYTPGNDRLSLRGVGRLTNIHAADSGTAIYTDGVFLTSATQAGRSPLFIERTEVLRGPQGTLYGRNAIGGTYNIISARPTQDFSGEVRLNMGNYDVYRVDGTVSIPINSSLRARFNFTENYQGDGFERNYAGNGLFKTEAGNRDEQYYEFQLEGTVSKFDFWLQSGKNIWHDSAPPGITAGGSFAPPDTTLGTGALPSTTFAFSGLATNVRYIGPIAGNPVLATGNLRAAENDRQFKDTLHDNENEIFHLTYHAPAFDVKYVGGWSRYHYLWRDDDDGTSVQSFTVPLNPTAAAPAGFGGFNCYQLSFVGRCAPATVYGGRTTTYEEIEEYYSHDITIASTGSGPLQYIAGLYYYHEKGANPVIAYDPNQPQIATPILPTGAAAAANPQRIYAYSNDYFSIVSKAVYGQVDYKIFDNLKLTGGIRYTQDDKKTTEEERFVYYGSNALGAYNLQGAGSLAPAIDITSLALGAATAAQLAAAGETSQQSVVGATTYDPTTGRYKRRLQDGSNDVTGTAGIEWSPDRRTLAYFKYSRGYKAFGLYAAQLPGSFSAFPYSKPEQMDNVEVGLKKDWTRRFQTNIVGFYDLYYNAQVPLSIQQGSNPAFSLFYNVPRSILQGVELESTWAPINHLDVLFTYAYLDAHVSKACCVSDPVDPTATQPGASPAGASSQGAIDSITGLPTRGQNLKGQALPFSPKNKIALNVNYTFGLGQYGDLIASGSYLWRDLQYSSFFNRTYNEAPSREQVDLRLTFRDARKRFDLIGYVRNVFDKDSFESVSGTRNSIGAIYETYNLVEPRTYGVELRARF